jgi:hypothetical protein
MPSFNFPKQQLIALESIAKLSDEAMESLSKVLASTEPALGPVAFSEAIASQVSDIEPDVCEAIVFTLSGLSFLTEMRGESAEETVHDIIKSAAESQPDTPAFTGKTRSVLASRLQKLMSYASLGISAKAMDVMTEHEKIFCGCRILSDLRPIFTNAGDRAVAGVVVHNLSIHYHQDDEHREFYAAMDANDLQNLKQTIIRAEQKERHIITIMQKADMKSLEVG